MAPLRDYKKQFATKSPNHSKKGKNLTFYFSILIILCFSSILVYNYSNNFSEITQSKIQSLINFINKPNKFQNKKWNFIVIHHSGTHFGNAKIYNQFHQEKYNQSLLYHFIIGNGSGSKDGEIEIGERWKKQIRGGHVHPSNDLYNEQGIGICLVGNFEVQKPTKKQISQLSLLTKFLMERFSIPIENVLLHSIINPTKCPGKLFPKNLFFSLIQ